MDAKQQADITRLISDMAIELHTMKGTLAANTAFTKQVLDRMDSMQEKQEAADEKVAAIVASNLLLLTGFPAEDIDGHRRYHEAVIEWRELRNKIMRETLLKLGQAGLFGGIGLLIALGWKLFKISVTQ